MSRLRVGVVGARRGRQGIGEHLARFAAAEGADVVGVFGTSPGSAATARDALAARGIATRAFSDPDALLAEGLDALVIASPAETHEAWLERALAARLHVLCEKPFVWGGADPVRTARRIEQAFAAAGLVLRENCQWPWTLPAFRALHQDAPALPTRSFEMWLGPSESGKRLLVDALSHPLSVLQALLPDEEARIDGVEFSTDDRAADRVIVSFRFSALGARVAVRVRLERTPEQPRPAGYAIDGWRAERRVRLPDYAQTFEDRGRSVPVPDPTRLLVAGFVEAVAEGAGTEPGPLARRLAWLAQIVAAWEARAGAPPPG